MSGPGIRVVIDRLVLRGVERGDAAAVRRALGAELEAMLAGAQVDGASVGNRLRLDVAPAASPAALGRSAGAAIVRALAAHKAPVAASQASPRVQRQALQRPARPAAGNDPFAWRLDDLLADADDDVVMVRPPSGDRPAVFRSRRPPSPMLPGTPVAASPATPPAAEPPATPPAAAPPTAPTTLSQAGIDFIRGHEGFHRLLPGGRVAAYPERIGGSVVWTIGWGSTGREIGPETIWTMAQCRQRFERQVAFFQRGVAARLRGTPTTQSEFDALVSLAYNAGLGGLDRSEVLKRHLAGDRAGAAQAFPTTLIRAGRERVVVTGLVRRRQDEANLYLGIPPPPPPTPPQPLEGPTGSRPPRRTP